MAPEPPKGSHASLIEANRNRAEASRHGGLGAAGYISQADADQDGHFLTQPGEVAVVDYRAEGMPDFDIAVAWDRIRKIEKRGFFSGLLGAPRITQRAVDLDLGCLFELRNGLRGGLQAFGESHGSREEEPYIFLSGDERTGDREGPDETILVNGIHWQEIERLLIYVYIYDGAKDWSSVRPQVQVRVPGEQPMIVTLNARRPEMSVCAVAGLENIRGGIKMTSYLEYFPGHAEMDRAFGYGLSWETGVKR